MTMVAVAGRREIGARVAEPPYLLPRVCWPHTPDTSGRRCAVCGAYLPVFRSPVTITELSPGVVAPTSSSRSLEL